MKVFKKYLLFVFVILFIITVVPFNSAKGFFYSPTKNEVGLNVHWTLGGGGLEDQYRERLIESKTKWVREHFSTEVLTGATSWPWTLRYDSIMQEYKDLGINVVGMLAYGPDHGVFTPPNLDLWEEFVRDVVARYNEQVKVWEIWNEPDSPDYLIPNNPDYYVPLLERAYDTIKLIDPQAQVLMGGLASPNTNFAESIAQRTNKFDGFNFHLYYCGSYRNTGNNQKLLGDLNNFKRIVNQYTPNQKAWITELGCSTGEQGIDKNLQKQYLETAIPQILKTGFVERILLYNIRNYDYLDNYENNFGLLDEDMNARPSWSWYKDIPSELTDKILKIVTAAGPGGGPHVRVFDLDKNPKEPNKFFPYAQNFKGGVNITTGDIDADNKDEIITAPRKGGGPQVRIFESTGIPKGIEFWPFSSDFKKGINVASGDTDGDSKDEIAMAPAQEMQAIIKVYRYNNDKTLLGQWNAFGNVACGASVTMGDINGDRKDEIIVGAGPSGGPQIRIFKSSGEPLPTQFFAFDKNYKGGINVTAGDVNSDGKDEIGVCQASEQSLCKIYSSDGKNVLKEWKAYNEAKVGVKISMGDVDRDGRDEIITGTEKGGGPQIRIFKVGISENLLNFFAYDKKFRGGADVALGNF